MKSAVRLEVGSLWHIGYVHEAGQGEQFTSPVPDPEGPERRSGMAAKGQSFAEKFSRWGVTVSNLKDQVEAMPHIAPDLTQLEQMLAQARELESRQEDLRGQVRELNAQLRDLTKGGERIRGRLRASLQGKFGFTSDALVKFGFKPQRIPRRVKIVEKPAPETPSPGGAA
jgi:hypothetical protein